MGKKARVLGVICFRILVYYTTIMSCIIAIGYLMLSLNWLKLHPNHFPELPFSVFSFSFSPLPPAPPFGPLFRDPRPPRDPRADDPVAFPVFPVVPAFPACPLGGGGAGDCCCCESPRPFRDFSPPGFALRSSTTT